MKTSRILVAALFAVALAGPACADDAAAGAKLGRESLYLEKGASGRQ